ncbi:hypothetical protein MN608_08634 [Microdochium nivale]|nr:hypothetical protein MN608_08634 [Microdochium nivale]
MSPLADNIKTGLKGLKGAGDVIRGTALQAADDMFDKDPNHPKTVAAREKNRHIVEQGKANLRYVDTAVGRRERAKVANEAPYEEMPPTTGSNATTSRYGNTAAPEQVAGGVAGATTGAHGTTGLHQDTGVTETPRAAGAANHTRQEIPPHRPQDEGLTHQEMHAHHPAQGEGLTQKDPAAYHAQEESSFAGGQQAPSYHHPTEQVLAEEQWQVPSRHTQEHGLAQQQELPAYRPQEGGPAQQEMPTYRPQEEGPNYTAQHEMPAQQQGVPAYPTRQQAAGQDGLPSYHTQQEIPVQQEAPAHRPHHGGLGTQQAMPPYSGQQNMYDQQQKHV